MLSLRTLDQEQQLIVNTIDELGEDYGHDYWRECVEEGRYPDELWQELGDLGFLGANVPEEYGGSELSMEGMATFVERLASHGVNLSFLVVSTTMAPMTISRYGNEQLKEEVLPGLASGETKFSFALTEAEAGTNSYQVSTAAQRDGDEYVVNGEKTWITGAGSADYLQLVARTTPYEEVKDDPKQGFSLFVVDADTPGIDYRPLNLATTDPMEQYTVTFDDVRVPEENRIGAEDEGFTYLFDALNPERITVAATASGHGKFALERATDYAKDREVWGVPIGSHQAIQHQLSRAFADLEQASITAFKAASAFDNGEENVGAIANIAKLAASEAADDAFDAAIQTLGGNGFSRDYGVINLERLQRARRIIPISNEMTLNHIGENVLGLPKSY